MIALYMVVLFAAVAVGMISMLAGVILLCVRTLRALGVAIMTGGLSGASAAFALFAALVVFGDLNGQRLFGEVAASVAAAGFGTGAIFGTSIFLLALTLRSPNQWADRRRRHRSN